MRKIDWDKIHESDKVDEISFVAAIFKIFMPRGPSDMQIEVEEYPRGRFMGMCNYSFWGPDQAGPYHRSARFYDSVEDAVNDAISGIRACYSDEFPSDVIFWEKSSGHLLDPIYIDGNGEEVPKDEVMARRANYKEK